MKTIITVEATIGVPVEKVWDLWNNPQHIVNWNYASDDWYCPKAENDLHVGGKLKARMEARDGSFGFDFEGIYDEVKPNERIAYTIGDGRKVTLDFKSNGTSTTITEAFEAEGTNPAEMQRQGWQAILDNFKTYAEVLATKAGSPEKLHYEIVIGEKPEKVYTVMLADKTYREWTKIFNAASRFEGSWGKGSKIVFLGSDERGNVGGMVSRIRENIPNRFVSIEHIGMIEDGKEITSGPKVDPWKGGLENYTFAEQNRGTFLSVDLVFKTGGMNEQMVAYFADTWPKALNKLKEICEQ
jgi:uncharacterized protein YndB with AHSA1/START domain